MHGPLLPLRVVPRLHDTPNSLPCRPPPRLSRTQTHTEVHDEQGVLVMRVPNCVNATNPAAAAFRPLTDDDLPADYDGGWRWVPQSALPQSTLGCTGSLADAHQGQGRTVEHGTAGWRPGGMGSLGVESGE